MIPWHELQCWFAAEVSRCYAKAMLNPNQYSKTGQKFLCDLFCGWLAFLYLFGFVIDMFGSEESEFSLLRSLYEAGFLYMLFVPATIILTVPFLAYLFITQVFSKNWIWLLLMILPFPIHWILTNPVSVIPDIGVFFLYETLYILLFYLLYHRRYLSDSKELKNVPLWQAILIPLACGILIVFERMTSLHWNL